MSTYNKKISGVISLFIVISFFAGLFFTKDSFADRGNHGGCEPNPKYVYASHDSASGDVNFDFKNGDNEIVISADSGYQITEVWLDVKDDNHVGYKLYGTAAGSYNPNPGTKIESAKVKVVRLCPTSTPTATQTAKPTCSPSNDPTTTPSISPTPTATATQSADPTATPCIECQEEPTPTPTLEPTSQPTPFDMCPNLEGIQTSMPNEYHHDNDGINCLKFELGGPSSSSSTQSQTQVSGGQVLGASTMAETGTLAENIYYSLFSIGSILTSLGIMKNAKSKR